MYLFSTLADMNQNVRMGVSSYMDVYMHPGTGNIMETFCNEGIKWAHNRDVIISFPQMYLV